jgi:hypothetical protein
MTLEEKMAKLRESTKTKDAIVTLEDAKGAFSKLDRSKLWSKHHTAMKHDMDLKAKYENAKGKSQQSLLVTAWAIDPSKGGLYMQLVASVKTCQTLEKTERWESWKSMENKFDAGEIELHLKSGRIATRESSTPGVWEYMDNGDMTFKKTIQKGKEVQQQQSANYIEDDLDTFKDLFDGTIMGLTGHSFQMGELAWDEGSSLKGKGKGKGLVNLTIMGKGKAKGQHGGQQVAVSVIEDQPAADPMEAGLIKAKQCLLLMDKTIMCLEEDHANFRMSKYYNAAVKKEFSKITEDLEAEKAKLKKVVLNKAKLTVEQLKVDLAKAVMKVKAAQEFVKEHKNLAGAASSSRSVKGKED